MTFNPNSIAWDDFLGRPRAERQEGAGSMHAGKTVLLTGGAGSIGSVLASVLVGRSKRLVILDSSEQSLFRVQLLLQQVGTPCVPVLGSVCDEFLLDEVFQRHRPEVVYHAAAFKHVPLMEANPFAAIRNNTLGSFRLVQAAVRHGTAKLLMISTDKAVNPRSIMGASKRAAELVLLALSGPTVQMNAIRLGNVLGSEGSVVPLFLEQIAGGGPVTVTHPEVRRYFLTMEEAVGHIVEAASMDSGAHVLVPELGEPKKIIDLARHLIAHAGTGRLIEIVYTGLRPGDKMSEELISGEESVEATTIRDLRSVKSLGLPRHAVAEAMAELDAAVCAFNLTEALRVMKRIVPEYQPSEALQQSVFESVIR